MTRLPVSVEVSFHARSTVNERTVADQGQSPTDTPPAHDRNVKWEQSLAIAVPAVVAVAGFFAAYLKNLRIARRKDQLDRVNRQLNELYGPLLALVSGSTRSWQAFRSRHRPDVAAFWDPADPPSGAEAEAWRVWMAEVFMPLNSRMEQLVVTKADLLETESIPDCLLDLVAHVASYRAVLAQWSVGDVSEHKAPLNFPGDAVKAHAEAAFAILKSRQHDLLDT